MNFVEIEDPAEICYLNDILAKKLADKLPIRKTRIIGYPVGSEKRQVCFSTGSGQQFWWAGWVTNKKIAVNLWGHGDVTETKSLNIDVQFNFSVDRFTRRTGGAFLRHSETGTIILAHRGIATLGHGRLRKEHVFAAMSDALCIATSNNGAREFLLIAGLESRDLVQEISAFASRLRSKVRALSAEPNKALRNESTLPETLQSIRNRVLPQSLMQSLNQRTDRLQRRNNERRVQCDITEFEEPQKKSSRLNALTTYRALVYVGAPLSSKTVSATEVLEEGKLPQSGSGHHLRIIFCPLNNIRETRPFIQEKLLFLPPKGNSEHVQFTFDTGEKPQDFRARILVIHQTRILQTLVLHTNSEYSLHLNQENMLGASIDDAANSVTQPVDVALLMNCNSRGTPGLTAITSREAKFLEPDGFSQSIQTVRTLLGKLNERIADVNQLGDNALVSTLKELANHGVMMLREMTTQISSIEELQNAKRVQLVEAVKSAYFPVEFLYAGKAPGPEAILCPNSTSALRDKTGTVHESCVNKGSRSYVCPAAFWGFSKCIERQPFGQTLEHVFSLPQKGASSIKPFHSGLYAASKRVNELDLIGPSGMESILKNTIPSLVRASSWDEMRNHVSMQPPSSVILLPHSLDSPHVTGMPALEISDTTLSVADLDKDFVNPEESAIGPVVMLLGCSTALTDIPFLNFVREFKRSGASIVLGTLAIIHGSKAVSFVVQFFNEMRTQMQSQTLSFDELLLHIKRQMLADGEPFVLSLAAYGHSGWTLEI